MAAAAAAGRSTHGYNLLPTIIKAGDDLIQEAFALQVHSSSVRSGCYNPIVQLVAWFERVWSEAGVNVLVRPYGVLPTEPGAGIIEVIQDPLPSSPSTRSIIATHPLSFLSRLFPTQFHWTISRQNCKYKSQVMFFLPPQTSLLSSDTKRDSPTAWPASSRPVFQRRTRETLRACASLALARRTGDTSCNVRAHFHFTFILAVSFVTFYL